MNKKRQREVSPGLKGNDSCQGNRKFDGQAEKVEGYGSLTKEINRLVDDTHLLKNRVQST